MHIRSWKQEILTIPNLLSLFRLVLLPIYVTLYLRAVEIWQYYAAGAIMAVSCVTDAIDGRIARRFHMTSNLGKILDPLADKVTQFTLTLCLSFRYPHLIPVLILFAAKELFQITIGLIHLRKGKILKGALMAGKTCTTVLFISLITMVLFPHIPTPAISFIAWIDALFLVVSLVHYMYAYWGDPGSLQDLE